MNFPQAHARLYYLNGTVNSSASDEFDAVLDRWREVLMEASLWRESAPCGINISRTAIAVASPIDMPHCRMRFSMK